MMLIFSAVIPQPLYAQIAAAPLDHSGGLFFSPEQQHPGVQGNYVMFPPSTYVLSPHASGWRKFQSVFLSGNYHSTDAKQTFEGSSAPAGRKDGKDTYNDGGVGSTFIINRIFFVDLNGKYSTGEYKGYTGLNEDSTLTRTAAGGNLNGGVRLWQILSLGIGYAQVNHETTFKVKGSDDYKASTSEVTVSAGFSLRLGNFFIGGGGDMIRENGKLTPPASKENALTENTYNKIYGGVGLSMGHPRDAELHIEANYISIPETTSTAVSTSGTVTKFERRAYTEYILNTEVIYFDFYFSIQYKQGQFDAKKSADYEYDIYKISASTIGIGYVPAKGFFLTLKGGIYEGKYSVKQFTNSELPTPYTDARTGYIATGALGFSF